MSGPPAEIDELLQRAGAGDARAVGQLLELHRGRLRNMVAVRIDPRLAPRIDPSDVVQEALVEASRKLPDYLRQRPLPFYPWLRQITWERLVHLQHRHLEVQKRAIGREVRLDLPLPDESACGLADRLAATGTSPSRNLIRQELRQRVRAALDLMAPHDREILVMWHLEELSVGEIAAVLEMTEAGVKSRHRRAVQRLLRALEGDTLET